MKWIGQHIWSFISRFRNDIYLEATETGTIASGGNLGLDSNNKIVKSASPSGTIDLTSEVTGTLPVSSGGTGATTLADNSVLTGTGTSAISAESNLTFDGSTLTATCPSVVFEHSVSGQLTVKNTGNNTTPGTIKLENTRGGNAGQDGDSTGSIVFFGNNDAGSPVSHKFAEILASSNDVTADQEAGELQFKVAEFDGTVTTGLKLDGDTNADGEVDVTIGAGAASTTTIAGTLTMGTTAAITNAGQLSVAAQPNITTMTGFLGGTANAIITDDGDGTVTSESTLTYTNEKLSAGNDDDGEFIIERLSHSDGDGGALRVFAGSATNGQTDKFGGDLKLYGGLGTGTGNGGDIQFYSHKRGSTGPTIGTAALLSNFFAGTSNTDFFIYEDAGASTDDYYRVRVSANGETLVTTHDAAAMAAHYKVDADGDITFDPATGVVRAGWHGSTTRIKILPRDFVANDVGRPLQIEDDSVGSNELFLFSHSTSDMFAYVPIPSGYKATHVRVYGNTSSENFYVYEGNINSKTIVDIGTGTHAIDSGSGTENALATQLVSDTTNYLIIRVTSGGATEEIHGGYVTILAV